MNTTQIECFISVAQNLSFAKAAQEMNISQPAVSHQIRSLEDELGVKLFYRSTRAVELTEEGLSFLDDAKSIAMIARHAANRFSSPDKSDIQSLSVGYSGCLKSGLLTQVLSALIKKFGTFRPDISEISPQRMETRLTDGTIDVYMGLKTDISENADISFKHLSDSGIMCLCRDDHPLTFCGDITTSALKNHRLIVCGNPPAGKGVKIRWLLTQERSVSDMIFCPSPETAVMLAQSGFGAAILPDVYVPDSAELQKYAVADIEPIEYGLYTRNQETNDLISDFVKEVRSKIKLYS